MVLLQYPRLTTLTPFHMFSFVYLGVTSEFRHSSFLDIRHSYLYTCPMLLLYIYIYICTVDIAYSISHVQGGAEETHVFQIASTRQGWG
jgi:hypothetical protein